MYFNVFLILVQRKMMQNMLLRLMLFNVYRRSKSCSQKKQQHLESQIDQEKQTAIRHSKQGNKRGALMALKRKKKCEKTLLQLDGTLTTLETQREYLQNASTNTDVLRVMKQAASALKNTNQNLDVDQVHDLMDDLTEQHNVGKIKYHSVKREFVFQMHFILICYS